MGVNYNLSEVRIEGLETLDYLDNLCNRERFTEQGDAITFESEVNSGFSLTAASHVKELASSALQESDEAAEAVKKSLYWKLYVTINTRANAK